MLSFPSRTNSNFGNLFRMPVGGKGILLLARKRNPDKRVDVADASEPSLPAAFQFSKLIHKLVPEFSQLALARISAAIESPF
jgi:hypothetical protein